MSPTTLNPTGTNADVVVWLKDVASANSLMGEPWADWATSGAGAAALYSLTLEACASVFGKVHGAIVHSLLHPRHSAYGRLRQ